MSNRELQPAIGADRLRRPLTFTLSIVSPSPLLPEIAVAFSGFLKPPAYVAEDLYEPERLDYEEMLGGKLRGEITALDFGLVSWSPLLHLTPAATGYLLPRLIELAETSARDRDGELFLMRVVNFLSSGPSNKQFSLLTQEQRALIVRYLQWQAKERAALFAHECWDFALEDALHKWCGDA